MHKKYLHTPLEKGEITALNLGDLVYLSGDVYTARDRAHQRILDYASKGKEIPVKNCAVIYHCGPLVRLREDGEWEIIAAGPTTSARMNEATPKVLEKLRIRAIIGKGGMDASTRAAMRDYGCVYLAMTGGAAVLAATRIERVENVHWTDLGMAEAVWHLRVAEFGPLVVGIDARGNSLYVRIHEAAK
ncbi:MAG: FumA C-terminus/TtdB family hydratase beta subunit [Halobacteriota archaeon]